MSLDRPAAPDPYDLLPPVGAFSVVSDDLVPGEKMADDHVFDDWGLDGGNVSPHLRWWGAPRARSATSSPASTRMRRHRAVSGTGSSSTSRRIPPNCRAVRVPPTAPGWPPRPSRCAVTPAPPATRAAPPEGDVPHRYYFVVHAVDVDTLGVSADASPAVVSFNLAFHTLARAVLVSTYSH